MFKGLKIHVTERQNRANVSDTLKLRLFFRVVNFKIAMSGSFGVKWSSSWLL